MKNQLLEAERGRKEFQAVMEEMWKTRPIVPAFKIAKTKDELELIVENIKYQSALRDGFDLLFARLTGRVIPKE